MKNNILLFFCVFLLECASLHAQNRRDSALQKFERFSGTVNTKAAAGVRVNVFNQVIGERQSRKALSTPFTGLMIVQLRGGDLSTVIDGATQKRTEGEFWTVAAHQSMQLLTEDNAASIQVILIQEDSAISRKVKAPPAVKDTAVTKTYGGYMPGIVRRKVFTANAQSSFLVEVWDMMAALGKRSEKISFPGAVVFEVRTGSASFIVDGKSNEMKTGSTLLLNEGSSLEIDTRKVEKPFNFRAVVIATRK